MPAPMEDTKLQILHDHYKDTFAHLQNHLKTRDRLFFFILVVVTLLLFQVFSPQEAGDAISQFVSQRLELKEPIDISIIGSVIWFSLLAIALRYFQTVVHIERQYAYIHGLEEQLSPNFDNKAFTREGKSYLSDYPLFSSWAHTLYTIVFPILLLVIVGVKIFSEWASSEHLSSTLVFNSAIALFILVSTGLYLLLVHFGK